MSKAEEDFRVDSGYAQLLARSERLPSSALPAVGLLMHVIAWRCLEAPRRIGTEPKCFSRFVKQVIWHL